ncbi:IS701 family transposase [Streptomyces sp. NBC_01264]|uniref:IS701 family transposase n=1 Tax=Streptomyces sp. NBC_01264 TaxID=2903804 RepID=UPI00225093C7|nr:IS701 family transposase [Streptomyces sp. NBC_01264]MCX4784519.1 IS701 family transposase [Streptomyces sp. NBC_01264]
MTTYRDAVAVEATVAEKAWGEAFGRAMSVVAGCFVRREARATAAELVTGLLLEVDTRNCWTLGQALGHPGPHRLQHLLSRARFDHDLARREIAGLLAGELAGQEVVLVVDETGDAKSSTDCVGAGRQYSGAIGGVGLCQVAVHLAAVTSTTKMILDRALYLPADWAADEERRQMAGVPEHVTFATKPQQALAMVTDALATGIEARWFAGDEVYCGRELRRGIRALDLGYVVGIPASYQVTDGAGHRREARKLVNRVRPGQWMRRQTGHGTKGTREYDWAWLDVRPDDTPDENENENENENGAGAGAGTSVLVARRHRYTGEVSFFRCWAPGDVSLATLVEVICRRWRIEEAFQLGKGFTGLDQGQVTCWNSWMRWSLFSLIAAAVLALTTAAVHEDSEPPPGLVPLTCPELIRLLRALVLPPPARDRDHVLHWIAWRRHHQAVATTRHQQRHHRHDQP